MSLINELNNLQELPPPDMPSYWPQTWGWAVLVALALIAAGVALIRWKRHWDANAYRRAALKELELIESLWRSDPDNPTPLRDVPGLLKRAVLNRPVKDRAVLTGVAGQHGKDWQAMLSGMATQPLPEHFSDQLATLAYAGDNNLRALRLEELITECRAWLETHHDPV